MRAIATAIITALIPFATWAQLPLQLHQIAEEFGVSGLAVATVCQGKMDQVYYEGLENVDTKNHIGDSTLFRVASISKLFTATAVMKLYDEKKCRLDDDINTYLPFKLRHPAYPEEPLTIAMLLSHTSGLQDGEHLYEFITETNHAVTDIPTIQDYFDPQSQRYDATTWHDHKPGTYFKYSNVNYGLLATIIEKISGKRFDQFMEEEIFDPMGIRATFNVFDLPAHKRLATLYRYEQSKWVPQADDPSTLLSDPTHYSQYKIGTNGFLFNPQGGLRIGLRDLTSFLIMHAEQNAGWISSSTLALMHQPHWTYDGSNGDTDNGLFHKWGLGVHIARGVQGKDRVFADCTMYGHPGEAYGLLSGVYFGYANGSGIVFISTGSKIQPQIGKQSSFYALEERIYGAAQQHLDAQCKEPIPAEASPFISFYHEDVTDRLMIRAHSLLSPQTIIIRNSGGMVLWEQSAQMGQMTMVETGLWEKGYYTIEAAYNQTIYHAWFQKK